MVLVLLVRCGSVEHPASPASAPAPVAMPRAAEVAVAPAPRAVVRVSAPNPVAVAEIPHLDEVRGLVSRGGPGCGGQKVLGDDGKPLPGQESSEVKRLRALGDAVHPAFAAIIVDPKSTLWELFGVSSALADKPGKHRQYVPLAVQRLTAVDALMPVETEPFDGTDEFQARRLLSTRNMVREWAIELIADHGDERDAAHLLLLLRSEDWSVRRTAADALVRIGGQPELDGMDAWLETQNPIHPLTITIKKRRDALETRLRTLPARRMF